MPVSVTMPALGESVTEGTVTRWLKQEGEEVQADEPLLEVSTDKVDTEIPSPASGVLTKIVVAEDETVEVGTELAVIGDKADSAANDTAEPAAGGASDDGADADGEQAPDAATQEVEQAAAAEPATQPSEPATADAAASDASGEAPSGAGTPSSSGGSTPITMPALGESVTEGTVTRWLKSVGDDVAVDEPLLEVSTDKVDTEIPSPVAGTLLEITVAEDETVAVGAQLALIGSADAPAEPETAKPAPEAAKPAPEAAKPAPEAAKPAPEAAAKPAPAPAAQQPADAPPSAPDPSPEPVAAVASTSPAAAPAAQGDQPAAYVTPLVRKLAAQHDVDLATVTGSGVGGRIRKQDVLEAAESAKAAAVPEPQPEPKAAVTTSAAPASTGTAAPAARPAPSQSALALRGTTEKLSRLRRVIATRMVESLQISAQLTTVVEVDITRITALRTRTKADFEAREGVKLSFLPFFAMAAVEALKAFPRVNSSVDMEAGTVTYHDSENLGVAVDTERGLLVPVIHAAGDLNLGGLARKIADLADRTRNNKITPDELGGGTFTLTNTGSRGALFDTPIINQPQSAILGTGTVVKRPVVMSDPELGEVVAVRSMVYLALSYDHRIVDGADAARFLVAMKHRLEDGDFESALGAG